MTIPKLPALLHRADSILSRWRALFVTLTGVRCGADVRIGPGGEIALCGATSRRGVISLGAGTQLDRGVIFHPYAGSIATGSRVYIGAYTVIYGHGGVTIGDQTLVSMRCSILSSNHTVPPQGTDIRSRPDIPLPTSIGRDVWLGAGVTVLGGVTIGDGCVVGAGAVVTKDLPPGSIAAGVPARIIGQRP